MVPLVVPGVSASCFCNTKMIMSAFTTVDMSSCSLPCPPHTGGRDGDGGHDQPESARGEVVAGDSRGDRRAVADLGVTVLHAHSPQATGRVERLFRTVQDRLINEWRLAGVRTIPAANAF